MSAHVNLLGVQAAEHSSTVPSSPQSDFMQKSNCWKENVILTPLNKERHKSWSGYLDQGENQGQSWGPW